MLPMQSKDQQLQYVLSNVHNLCIQVAWVFLVGVALFPIKERPLPQILIL
jgi:hypothetical protein